MNIFTTIKEPQAPKMEQCPDCGCTPCDCKGLYVSCVVCGADLDPEREDPGVDVLCSKCKEAT